MRTNLRNVITNLRNVRTNLRNVRTYGINLDLFFWPVLYLGDSASDDVTGCRGDQVGGEDLYVVCSFFVPFHVKLPEMSIKQEESCWTTAVSKRILLIWKAAFKRKIIPVLENPPKKRSYPVPKTLRKLIIIVVAQAVQCLDIQVTSNPSNAEATFVQSTKTQKI